MNQPFKVILYYQFGAVGDPEAFRAEHKRRCEDLGLLGRVYIAGEGINGTLAGTIDAVSRYKSYLRAIPGFESTAFKEEETAENPFVKLIVKTRPEIVTLKASVPIDMTRERGKHLSPGEWRNFLESRDDITVIDVRNDYESAIGHFEGAVTPPVRNFFDFEKWVDEAGPEKDKTVLMYCTGGIRCEKFSLLMEKKGYPSVFQLDGGIINYAQKEKGAHFKGKCFVFDDRLTVPVNPEETEPISRCAITGVPCDSYVNCANVECNNLFICSKEGLKKYDGCCSASCRDHGRLRPVDKHNPYKPARKWHTYRQPEGETFVGMEESA